MLSGKDADGFSAIALAIFTRRSVRRRSPNSAVPNVSTAHFSGCSSPAMSICLTPFVYIVSPSSLPEFVLTCQARMQDEGGDTCVHLRGGRKRDGEQARACTDFADHPGERLVDVGNLVAITLVQQAREIFSL